MTLASEQVARKKSQLVEPAIELGDFAGDDASQETARRSLVVATYNIRYGVGSRLISGSLLRRLGLSRPGRRASLVGGNLVKAARAFSEERLMPRADLIALQEADRRTVRAGSHDVARELAEHLRMRYARAAMPTPVDEEPLPKQWYLDFEQRIEMGETGDTGVAILSRLPLGAAERVELPWHECAWRPRLALHVVVPFGASRLHVFNTHIDPHATLDEQLSQHAAVLSRAAALGEREPRLLVGDFNTLVRRARVEMRRLLEAHGYKTPLPDGTGTWRAGPLRLHADWIFARGLRVVRWGVARPLRVSDHWPVWAEVEVES
ncbi:MAG TPA: endonuclease/exonuclease/phosphatase family protein [Pyrinomonadaceae bacterium]